MSNCALIARASPRGSDAAVCREKEPTMSGPIRSLDRITIPQPCDANWDEMIGNDQFRFCAHCSLHVTNLSSMTRQDAIHFVSESRGRICIRYIERPNGGVLTQKLPEKLYRIDRRASRLAAGAFP